MSSRPPQIKSRERVRDIAEVYTRDDEINAMLDLVGDVSHNIEARFLEPSAGNGNFLVRILERKLETVLSKAQEPPKRKKQIQKDFEFYALQALASLYAVDISAENVEEARDRLRIHIADFYSTRLNTHKPTAPFYACVRYILGLNVIAGDMINGTKDIRFTEFSAPRMYKFTQRVYALSDLLGPNLLTERRPQPIYEIAMRNYWELADAD